MQELNEGMVILCMLVEDENAVRYTFVSDVVPYSRCEKIADIIYHSCFVTF